MPQEFTLDRQVTFAETDMAGIVHFSNFFRYMEETEHAFFRSLDLSVMLADADGHLTWPRVATDCNFTTAIRFEDIVRISLHIAKVGRSSLTFSFRFARDGQPIAQGSIKTACCQFSNNTLRAIPIPEWLLEKFNPYVAENDS